MMAPTSTPDTGRLGRRLPALALLLALLGGPKAGAAQTLGPHDGRDLPPADLDRVEVGDTAPDFTLESYDDGTVTLSDFRGRKNVVLVFYRGFW
jgi:cytochrome oxidase Cu insertion factor (SCO1/SenC/PrrC family)